MITSILLIPIVIAIFMAINMGASGTAPSFAAPYGANLIRKAMIPGLFGLFVLLGAVIAGEKVIKTLGGQILPSADMTIGIVSIILFSCAVSLFVANLLKVPQSTSQSTVFAIAGVATNMGNMKYDKLFFEIVPTWFILPLICFVLTYFFTKFAYYPMKKRESWYFSQIAQHSVWKYLTIVCACYVAFSIGSNNVANAAGPIASLIGNEINIESSHSALFSIMLFSTVLIAPWFGIGSSLMGERVLDSTGKQIVQFGPLGATFISFITASLLLMASITKGIPTSLVQLNIAAIFAIGIAKVGSKEIFSKKTVSKILFVWLIAPAIAFVSGYGLTFFIN